MSQSDFRQYGAASMMISRGVNAQDGMQAGLTPVRPQFDQMLADHISSAQRSLGLLEEVVRRLGRPIDPPPLPAAPGNPGPQGPAPIYVCHRETLEDLDRRVTYIAETLAQLV